jgi:PAS domain S-box-containing protein
MSDAPRSTVKLRFSGLIIALISIGILSLAVIGSVTAAFFINKRLSDIAIDQGSQITATLAHQSILSLLSGVGENARADVEATLNYPSVRGIAIFDRGGALLISAGEKEVTGVSDFPGSARPFEPVLKHEREDAWEFAASVYDIDLNSATPDIGVDELYIKKPELLGFVSVTIDRSSLYKIQQQLLRESLLIFIGVALVLIAIAVIISRQMTRPLHQLAGLMKHAEEGQEGIRATLDGPLEIHDMARAFNTMMEALEQRQTYAEEQRKSLAHEISERQLIEQELRESEHRLVSIFNNVVDGILILDDVGVIESANPVALSMLHLADGIVGRGFGDVINELAADDGVLIQADIAGLVSYCSGDHHLSIKGQDHPLEMDVKFSDMKLKGNKKYIAIVRDITESLQQKSRIESLLAQHEAIVSSVPGLIMELDSTGQVLWCNQHSKHVVGCSAAELQHENIIQHVAERDRQKMEETIAAALAVGKAELHAELVTTNGTIPYQFNMAHMSTVADNAATLLVIALDDSQSMTAQQALKKARDAALESARIKSEFLANMSHEIRTPMNGMFGMLQLLSGSDLNEEQHSYAEIALRSADQLLHIINDILDFSKIEAGKLELDRIEMSPRTVIEDAVELFSQRAQSRGVKLYAKVAVNVPDIIYGDPTRLNQIIANLIGNAIKFTDHGHILVHCSVERDGVGLFNDSRLVITVEDTGIGIDAASQGRIFESFIQADGSSTRRYSGTGLGLAIVKQLTELMGGAVSVTSEPGRGSEFTVTVPLLVPDDEVIVSVSPMIPEYRLARYVGDDQIAASILGDYLKSMGYRVEMVTPDHALWRDELSQPCDLYLLDYDQGSDALIAQLSGKTARVVVMMNQYEKSHQFTPPEEVQLCKLIKPVRYHALFSCLKQEVTAKPASGTVAAVRVAKPVVSQQVKILVVEDNETNLRVINSMLTKLGYSAVNVRSGEDAVEWVKQERFDIIFMDCQMPLMDGYQATGEIRRGETAGEHTIIIAMTGNAMTGDREKCLNAGMDDYIAKPVRLTVLQEVLSKWVEQVSKI